MEEETGSPHHALFWPFEVKGFTMVGLVTLRERERAAKLGRTSSDREWSKRDDEPGPTVSGGDVRAEDMARWCVSAPLACMGFCECRRRDTWPERSLASHGDGEVSIPRPAPWKVSYLRRGDAGSVSSRMWNLDMDDGNPLRKKSSSGSLPDCD
jgi:hypothetical protein